MIGVLVTFVVMTVVYGIIFGLIIYLLGRYIDSFDYKGPDDV